MSDAIVFEKEEAIATPHWSHSRIAKYLQCPEQYRLHYVVGLRTRIPTINLVFGKVIHGAMADLFTMGDPVQFFQQRWENLKHVEMDCGKGETWERYRIMGERLIEKFMSQELERVGTVTAVEKAFTLTISNLTL